MLELSMRILLALLGACALFAQQPIIYNRGTLNAASLAPFGLPNAPIAQGSIFTTFGENIGPSPGQQVSSFPLGPNFAGVSISVTQGAVTTQAYPIYVSARQVNAVMPSSVTPGMASLRVFYNNVKSNAIPIQIAASAPGIFAVSAGGYGPGIIQNFVSSTSLPVNSSVAPAAPGQTIIIWGTGLGAVAFPDNVAPTAGNVSTPVSVTLGGQPATVAYSGRSPCCSGLDQIVVNVPDNTPLGCWVPVTVNAGGVVSNTATMAVAAPRAASCRDPGNPLSNLVLTSGTQAFIHLERLDSIDNVDISPASQRLLDEFYSRFFTRPASPYNFDPYMSFPPAGTCLVHQTSGDFVDNLRGVLPANASLTPQPKQSYNNGSQLLKISPGGSEYSTMWGGNIDGTPTGANLLGSAGAYTIDPGGSSQTIIPLAAEPAPAWARPSGIIVIPRTRPLALSFTPGDPASPTAISIYSYAAATNSAVAIQCLAAPGANSFTISTDTLANLPPSYQIADGSYANLVIGSLGLNNAQLFHNDIVANGVVLNSSWVGQAAVIR
jgi:uncharacterized protein (TIGR03437 family)